MEIFQTSMKIYNHNVSGSNFTILQIINLLKFHIMALKLLFRYRATKITINLLFLQKNLFIEPSLLRTILTSLHISYVGEQPIIYYFNNTVNHAIPSQEINQIHRPVWSPILFKQLFYLGNFLIIVDKKKTTIQSVKDLDYFINTQNPLIIKIDNINYFEIVDHPLELVGVKKNSKESRNLFVPQKSWELNGLTVVIPTTFLNHNLAEKHSLYNLIIQLSKILNENGLVNKFEIFLVYGPEYIPNLKDEFTRTIQIDNFGIKFIEDTAQFNFSKRVNLAAKFAKYDTIWILNDDIIIQKSINLSNITSALSESNVASASVLLQDQKNCFTHAGISITENFVDEYLKGTNINVLDPGTLLMREVDGNSFACVFIRKEVFEIVGYLDESYPLDFNDVEWCLRANSMGLHHVLVPQILGFHDISSTRGSLTSGEAKYEKVKYKFNIDNQISAHEWIIPFCCLRELRATNDGFVSTSLFL